MSSVLAVDYAVDSIPKLGRGTSSLEGMGLSHAIAESLITRQASHSISDFSLVKNYSSPLSSLQLIFKTLE